MKDINKKSRTVSEALDTRLTCRAFKSTAIKKEVIFNILDKAVQRFFHNQLLGILW